jgi:large subunit ribosomal protein L1
MPQKSKKYRRNADKVPADPVVLPEAVKSLKKFENAKFDETVEVSVKLGIDTKNTAQSVRGAFSLPHGIGREVRVIAFVEGAVAEEARKNGAMEVGGEELAKRIQDGWIDFDVAIAHPNMMRIVGRLGRVLGPHGKMPTPKSGTVTESVAQAVSEFRAGKVEFRNDDGGNVHAVVGRKSFAAEKLVENITAFLEHLQTLRPASAKGNFVQKVVISSTMSPGVRVSWQHST